MDDRMDAAKAELAAVLFLGMSGLHWLYQFAEHARQRALNVLMEAAMVASLAFLISVAFADIFVMRFAFYMMHMTYGISL